MATERGIRLLPPADGSAETLGREALRHAVDGEALFKPERSIEAKTSFADASGCLMAEPFAFAVVRLRPVVVRICKPSQTSRYAITADAVGDCGERQALVFVLVEPEELELRLGQLVALLASVTRTITVKVVEVER